VTLLHKLSVEFPMTGLGNSYVVEVDENDANLNTTLNSASLRVNQFFHDE